MIKKSAISIVDNDAKYLSDSIKSYYNYVDEIILGLDKDRISWDGKPLTFSESELWADLQTIDKDNKVSIIEDNFHNYNTSIENNTYERNFLKQECSNDWIISIDANEQLINANDFFTNFCPLVEMYKDRLDVCMKLATPYKIIDDTVLIVVNNDGTPYFNETHNILTNVNNLYAHDRWTNTSSNESNRIIAPLIALNGSLDRELNSCVDSVHSSVTLDNYTQFKDISVGPNKYPALLGLPFVEVESYYKSYLSGAY